MKWLKIDYIKRHSRIEYDCEDDLLRTYAEGAEDTILSLCNRTYENLIGEHGGTVPAAIMHASLMLCDASYTYRSPASPANLSVVPYSIDLLIKPYVLLAGVPLVNERNRILDALQSEYTNIGFFAADDTSETKDELIGRITQMVNKFASYSDPTPMILENMRKQLAALQEDVAHYLESLNEE